MTITCKICNQETKYKTYSVFTLHHLKKEHPEYTTKRYYDEFLKKENEEICTHCNKPKTFLSIHRGYKKYCSDPKCRTLYSDINEKKKKTFLERYGVEHYNNPNKARKTLLKNGTNKIRVLKSKQTKLDKYGDEHYNNMEKHKETCLEKYGVDSHFKDTTIKKQIEDVCLEKYGVKYNIQNKETLNKTNDTMLRLYNGVGLQSKEILKKTQEQKHKHDIEALNTILEDLEYKLIKYEPLHLYLECNKYHSFDITRTLFNYRKNANHKICTVCNPIGVFHSSSEKEVLEFIKENYNGDIEENNKYILKRKELDIYLPDLNLAFEYNGVYWHNELYKDKDYHLNKTKECLDQHIQLIHIYEDDWLYKRDIVKSRILNLLGKSERIYARKCVIGNVDNKTSILFQDNNHIQRSVNSKYNIGLYYNDELVSLMTFGNSRFEKDKVEMLRFCNKLNISVIGGASRLFKYFINNNDVHQEIISYADRSWSKGGLYETLGFKLIKETKPNYYYVVNKIKENRFKYRKSELVNDGYDKEKTEKEIMFNRGIYRIYDSGSLKYMYKY